MGYRLCGLIVRVRVVLRRTVVGDIDRRFDNLSGSHHQSHVMLCRHYRISGWLYGWETVWWRTMNYMPIWGTRGFTMATICLLAFPPLLIKFLFRLQFHVLPTSLNCFHACYRRDFLRWNFAQIFFHRDCFLFKGDIVISSLDIASRARQVEYFLLG